MWKWTENAKYKTVFVSSPRQKRRLREGQGLNKCKTYIVDILSTFPLYPLQVSMK